MDLEQQDYIHLIKMLSITKNFLNLKNTRVQIQKSNTVDELKIALKVIETRISKETLQQFKSSVDVWEGHIADQGVFELWLGITKELTGNKGNENEPELNLTLSQEIEINCVEKNQINGQTLGTQVNDTTNTDMNNQLKNCATQNENTSADNQIVQEIMYDETGEQSDKNKTIGEEIIIEEPNNIFKENKENQNPYISPETVKVMENVPSPFKTCLFWPSTPASTSKRKKEKIPSVASGTQWKEYHLSKKRKKRN